MSLFHVVYHIYYHIYSPICDPSSPAIISAVVLDNYIALIMRNHVRNTSTTNSLTKNVNLMFKQHIKSHLCNELQFTKDIISIKL